MTVDFKEEPLVKGVYLRAEHLRRDTFRYSIRPETCITTFPLWGTLYMITSGKELENPTDDIVALLEAQKAPYEQFKNGVELLYEIVAERGNNAEHAVKEITRVAKTIFFKNQLSRLSLVGNCLNERIEDNRKISEDSRTTEDFHDDRPAYLVVCDAVTGLHRAVVEASYSFDRIVLGTGVQSESKLGEEPDVTNPLERATKMLIRSAKEEAEQGVAVKLNERRTSYLEGFQVGINKGAKIIFERLKKVSK
jgi:hypothetical protein